MRLTAHFGRWLAFGRRGRNVRRWQVAAEPDLRPGEEMLPTAQAGAGHPCDASWNRGRSQVALQGLGFSGRLNTAFIERVNLTVRHGVAALARRTWATAQPSPHLLAHLEWWRAYYQFVASPRIAASSAHAATRTRGQPFGSTLPAAYASHGSRKNDPTMDRARSAVLSLTKCARLETGSANALREASRNGSGKPTRGNNLPEPSKAGKMSSKYVHPLSALACY